MVVQSGFHGICYVMFLRKRPSTHERPSEVHYISACSNAGYAKHDHIAAEIPGSGYAVIVK